MIGKTTCNWNDFLSQRKCISGKISFVSVTPVIGICLLSLRSLTDCLNKLFVYLKLSLHTKFGVYIFSSAYSRWANFFIDYFLLILGLTSLEVYFLHISALTNLKELQLSNCSITDFGVSFLRCIFQFSVLSVYIFCCFWPPLYCVCV